MWRVRADGRMRLLGETVLIGNGDGEPVRLPPLDLSNMVPFGYTFDGRCFEFIEGGGSREVDGWSWDSPNGLHYEIRGGLEPEEGAKP